jgi:hypothetical protein
VIIFRCSLQNLLGTAQSCQRLDLAQRARNTKVAHNGCGDDRRVRPLTPNLEKSSKAFLQGRSLLDQNQPSHDVIDSSAGRLETDLQVAERLTGLTGEVVGDHLTGRIDAILAADHHKIMCSRDAYRLGKSGVGMQLWRIDVADCVHGNDTRTEWRPWT